MDLGYETCRWYALQVRSRREGTIAGLLCGQGYETFLPLFQNCRRWSDRMKKVKIPLFAGYMFCRLNDQNRGAATRTPGVIRVVGFGGTHIPVEEEEISAIQQIAEAGVPNQPWPFLQVGTRVRVEQGALGGLEGILVECKGQQRLIISVTLLQRSVALEVERDWVSLVN